MKNHVIVATYHKTGTVWMHNVFRLLCESIPASFFMLSRDQSGWTDAADQNRIFAGFQAEAEQAGHHAVIFENHCNLPAIDILQGCRGFRVVRDPRDVLISSANYHVRSDEGWLHTPRPAFGGMTYAEKLNSLDSFEDRIRFEMDNVGGQTIARMAAFDKQTILETVRYEDLITDVDMQVWRRLMLEIGLEEQDLDAALAAFWKCSLFGGVQAETVDHSTGGEARQWVSRLSEPLQATIASRFAQEIEALGYDLHPT
jgi:hypothetical protein